MTGNFSVAYIVRIFGDVTGEISESALPIQSRSRAVNIFGSCLTHVWIMSKSIYLKAGTGIEKDKGMFKPEPVALVVFGIDIVEVDLNLNWSS